MCMGLFMLGWKVLNTRKLPKYACVKGTKMRKKNRAIVESTHLSNTCVTYYNHHFVIYNKYKSKNTQLISNVVWKVVYASYKSDYLELEFQEET